MQGSIILNNKLGIYQNELQDAILNQANRLSIFSAFIIMHSSIRMGINNE